ncbi:replication-relaxation family protein [Kitasatospora sp. NPDC085895]|uniref:replication-relaxation family protein n=1 Tax=Kitasatospora sp. NPDC085895 TaxID=3155057 RepID=UPI003450DFA9
MSEDQGGPGGQRIEDDRPPQPQPPVRSGRVHFRRSARNPNGSTAALRADVLAVLGVLKVATYKQLHALVAADEYRAHRRVEHVAEAVRDLQGHRLVEERGFTSPPGRTPTTAGGRPVPGGPGAEKIVGLTAAGLIAAGEALGDDRQMGGHARGAGRTGAPHAMLVNEIVVNAVTGTTTHGAPPRTDPRQAPPRRALKCGPLPGGLDAWATEVAHTITGKHTVIPDAVVRLPELGIPVLFLELDRGTMTDIADVAAKLDNYKRWFDKVVKDTDGYDRTIFEVTYGATNRRTYGYTPTCVVRPPVAFVLDPGTRGSRPRFTPDTLRRRMKALRDATSGHWAGMRHEDEGVTYYSFRGRIPVLATTTGRLREHGFPGPAWWRFGRSDWQSLADALDDRPDRDLIAQRRTERQDREAAEKQAAATAKQDAEQAKWRAQLLTARAHNDALHPCYTCHGPLGGAHDTRGGLHEPAEPDRLECPACLHRRREQHGRPIVLALPTARDLRRAAKHGPPTDDPWWPVRLIYAERWPKAAWDEDRVPELWPNARA